jgi:chloramphenicol-sensitive protein RarD
MSQTDIQEQENQTGVIALVVAASIWGCFPLYWDLMGFTNALDVLSNRIIWSFFAGILLLRFTDQRFLPGRISVKQLLLLFFAASFLSANWATSIYSVQINKVVEGGIGMYFSPVFQMIIGCVLFKEAFNCTKLIVLVLSTFSIGLLIYDLGETPYIAVGMGLSFAFYATLKKLIDIPARESFIYETGLMIGPALIYMVLFGSRLTSGGFENHMEMALLLGAGIVAVPPLVLYGFGAQRTTLATSGMILNFIPILNIVVGVSLLGEVFTNYQTMSAILISCAVFYYSIKRGQ